jgi:hypothetical protein
LISPLPVGTPFPLQDLYKGLEGRVPRVLVGSEWSRGVVKVTRAKKKKGKNYLKIKNKK